MTVIRCDRCNKELDNSYYFIKFWEPGKPYEKRIEICKECWEKFIKTPSTPFVDEIEDKKVKSKFFREVW